MHPERMTAYSEYVVGRWSALYRSAYLITGDHEEAQDALQSTLLQVYVKWGRVRAAASTDAYVHRMLFNEILGRSRRARRRRAKQHLVPETSVQPVTDLADRLDLWREVAALPPRQRAVLVLRYYEDLDEARIAEILGCSRGTVKSQAHDALRALRKRLGGQEVPR